MGNKIVACPTCGALGEIGAKCPFCEGLIVSNDEEKTIKGRIPRVKTISAELFAERISKYSSVSPFKNGLAVAGIGSLEGLINKNGDIIIPISYEQVLFDQQWALLLDEEYYLLYNIEEGCFYDVRIKRPNKGYYSGEDQFDDVHVKDGWSSQVIVSLHHIYHYENKNWLNDGRDHILEDSSYKSYIVDTNNKKEVFNKWVVIVASKIFGFYNNKDYVGLFDMSGNSYHGDIEITGENEYTFHYDDNLSSSIEVAPQLDGSDLYNVLLPFIVSSNESLEKKHNELLEKAREERKKKMDTAKELERKREEVKNRSASLSRLVIKVLLSALGAFLIYLFFFIKADAGEDFDTFFFIIVFIFLLTPGAILLYYGLFKDLIRILKERKIQ